MITCVVLAGQIVLSSSAPDGETIIFPQGMGVQIANPALSSKVTFFNLLYALEDPPKAPWVINFPGSYEDVVAALSNCRTD